MERNEILKKITSKREFSQLPGKDVEMAFEKFDKEKYSDEEKIKFTRDLLRKTFSGFSGRKLLSLKKKSPEEILQKHLSTRERCSHYEEIYSRILKDFPKRISIIDLGAGVNGLSYKFFNRIGKEVHYIGIEAVGQWADLANNYFENEKLDGKILHLSLFEPAKVKEIIKNTSKPRIIFLFKVIDSLEKFERDYTKKLLDELVPFSDRIVISFATESWVKRKRFYANRKWLLDFIADRGVITDDFEISGERYIVFARK